jgi:hypothetical protein
LAAVRERIAEGGLTGAVGSSAAVGVVKTASVMLVGVVVAGGVVLEGLRPHASETVERTPVEAPIAVAVGTAPVLVPAAPGDPRPVAADAAARSTSDARVTRRPSTLAEEVELLSRAEAERRSGRPSSALRLLDEHQARFARGGLTEERVAARVHALCALGRVAEASAELERLKRLAPRSPQEASARQACAVAEAKRSGTARL